MNNSNNQNHHIPKTHPRYQSLKYRHKIIEGMKKKIVAEAGLIAHGRGECFDYILGERTNKFAKKAIQAAVAALLTAKRPVISVNGNTAVLIPKDLVKLSKIISAPLEINLFYKKKGRVKAIKKILEKLGAVDVKGASKKHLVEIEGLESNRRFCEAIIDADLIMVPLEDGDRTEALKKLGKKVIAVDLNPLSRTSIWADITIVDNIVRVLPRMIALTETMKDMKQDKLLQIVNDFNNRKNIQNVLDLIKDYIDNQKEKAFHIIAY